MGFTKKNKKNYCNVEYLSSTPDQIIKRIIVYPNRKRDYVITVACEKFQ